MTLYDKLVSAIVGILWLVCGFNLILLLAKRSATKSAREANQFLRDMGAPTGLKVRKIPDEMRRTLH